MELDLDPLAVDVGREVENVALHHALVVLVHRRPGADVGDTVEGGRKRREMDTPGVDTVRRDQLGLRRQVDRRPAQALAHAVSLDHRAGDGVGATEHLHGVGHPALVEGLADAGAGDPLAAEQHLFAAVGGEAQLGAQALQ